jgi:protein-glutamine gamma-glutamyltransferase
MPGKTFDYFRKLSAPREIEDSGRLRVAVWASVSISILALALQGVASPALVGASIILVSLGSYSSWRRRYKRNTLMKILIAALTIAALVSFLRQVFQQPYDPRLPLAELFVWVQVLHSFDLPRRKDLVLTLVSSLILISLAGSFALSASFAWLVILWLATALTSLYFAQLSRLNDLSGTPENAVLARPSLKHLSFVLVMLLIIITGTGLAVGAVMPRPSMSLLRSLPFSLRRTFDPSRGFQFTNPGYPNLPTKPPDYALELNPEAYFGFSPFLDLRTRGSMADLAVMKVRATEPAYWGGLYFQEYNGYSWLTSEEEPKLLETPTQPFDLSYDIGENHLATRDVIQTYYLQSEQPNVIFAASRPHLVYFPSDYIYQSPSGLTSPYALSKGLVYSVVSDRIVPEDLKISSTLEVDREKFAAFLEVPPLPDRVLDLASRINPNGGGPYTRAKAIEKYLKEEYTYSLDVPPLPEGEDALDFFLFESRCGYCEHFATAYAILCRLSGIPSRVVTGYSTGSYNPFSGLYEVSLMDAHAWVEIYLQGIGWVTCEPTPSFSLPSPGQGSGSLWIFGDFLSWVGNRLSSLLPGSLRSALKTAFSAMGSAAAALFSGIAYSVRQSFWLPLLLLLVLLLYPLFYYIRRRSRRGVPPAAYFDDAVLAMHDFIGSLEAMGLRRDPSQTAEEYVGGLGLLVPGLNVSSELHLFERARYGQYHLLPEELAGLKSGLENALAHIRFYFKPHHRAKKSHK